MMYAIYCLTNIEHNVIGYHVVDTTKPYELKDCVVLWRKDGYSEVDAKALVQRFITLPIKIQLEIAEKMRMGPIQIFSNKLEEKKDAN